MKVTVEITADGAGEYELDLSPEEVEGIRKLAAACAELRDRELNVYLPEVTVTV